MFVEVMGSIMIAGLGAIFIGSLLLMAFERLDL